MNKLVIATHGTLAEGFHNTLDILGVPQENLVVMNFYCGKTQEESEITRLFMELSEEDQMIVFTDVQYGSVNQMFMKAANQFRDKNVAILTGVNLPLILEIAIVKEPLSRQQLMEIIEKARRQMDLMDINVFDSPTIQEDIF